MAFYPQGGGSGISAGQVNTIIENTITGPTMVYNTTKTIVYASSGDNILVINSYTNIIAATITTSGAVGGMVLSPNGQYLYAVSGSNVLVIDTSTNAITATIAVSSGANNIAITPNGNYLYVTNGATGIVSVISTSTNTVTTTISVGAGPIALAITPNGDYVYVVNNGGPSVSVISTSTNTATATIPIGTGPAAIAITPDGNYAYVANNVSNSISVIYIPTNTIISTISATGLNYIATVSLQQNNIQISNAFYKNRAYLQDLTALTTTSTTAVALGSPITITPNYGGYIVIDAVVRVNNNTLSDGVTVSLLNGTTVVDSETYTQEGLASNSHTIDLHYELQNQTLGTALTLALNFNAVTGGTASAKIVRFEAKEIPI